MLLVGLTSTREEYTAPDSEVCASPTTGPAPGGTIVTYKAPESLVASSRCSPTSNTRRTATHLLPRGPFQAAHSLIGKSMIFSLTTEAPLQAVTKTAKNPRRSRDEANVIVLLSRQIPGLDKFIPLSWEKKRKTVVHSRDRRTAYS